MKKFTHEVWNLQKSLHILSKNVKNVYTEQTCVNLCKLRPKFTQVCPPMYFDRFVSSSVLRITCCKTNAMLLPRLCMIWAIRVSFARAPPWVKDGFRKSSKIWWCCRWRWASPDGASAADGAASGPALGQNILIVQDWCPKWCRDCFLLAFVLQWIYTYPYCCFQFWNNANNSENN